MPITGSTRSDLQRYRFLYKLQVEAFAREDQTGENDVIARFLHDFLPLIRPILVPCM